MSGGVRNGALACCDLAMPGVAGLHPYQPGKPIAELRREYGVTEVVKLASNENPLGPSPAALAAAREALQEVHRYPDGAAFELRSDLAAALDVAPEALTLGNGSNDLLDLVARAFLGPGRNAVISQHAFAIYGLVTRAVGARPVLVPAHPAHHPQPRGHDLAAMAEAVTAETSVVFVANPNNPTGTWADAEAVDRLLERIPPRVLVVLDEAYQEYARERVPGFPEGLPRLARHPNLVLTRSFSKAQGLAGLRVGYAVSHPAVADLLNRVRHPFNTSIPAQAAARAALRDSAHVAAGVALNGAELPRLARALADRRLGVLPSAGNFLCVDVGDAPAVNQGLLRRGVIVRPLAEYGLPSCLRVSIGTAAENDVFLGALDQALADAGAAS